MKRNSDNNIIVRDRGTDNAKISIKDITWFVPHYTPNNENQTLVMEQLLNEEPTELFYKWKN